MPKRPADVTEFIKELLEDSPIFRDILGMQGAAALHVRAFKRFQSTPPAGIVSEILLQEIEKIDDFIRYGRQRAGLQRAQIWAVKKKAKRPALPVKCS